MLDTAHSILFLTPSGETLPSVRFRVIPFVRQGQNKGFSVDWRRIPKTFHQRFMFLYQLPHTEIMIIQQKLLSVPELWSIRKKCERLIFDFDDAVWTVPSGSRAAASTEKRRKKLLSRFMNTCQAVDLCIAGNAYLAEKAAMYKAQVEIIPTLIDTDMFTPGAQNDQQQAHGQGITVGWIGTSINYFYLTPIVNLLLAEQNELELMLISEKRPPLEMSEKVTFEFWDADRETAQIQAMDIGLMPLVDDDYARGKCGFKILQYMACGVVPVASNVGFNRQIIDHGLDGFLVDTPEQWLEYIQVLIADPALRDKMAQAARAKIVRSFSHNAVSGKFWQIISEMRIS